MIWHFTSTLVEGHCMIEDNTNLETTALLLPGTKCIDKLNNKFK